MHSLIRGALRRSAAPGVAPRGESGFILIMTLLILAVLIALVGAVGVSAINVGNTSNQVALRDRAYAAADAGLQSAIFRLNQTGGTTGATGTMGNGANYSYTVSTLSSQSTPCAGLWVQSSGQSVQQDCVTSTGTVNGYTVKVQDRIVGFTPIPSIFPVNGIFAVNGFTAAKNLSDSGTIASNGQINLGTGGGGTITGNIEYLAQYPVTGNCSGTCVPVQMLMALAMPSSSATTPSAYAQARASNSDSTINWSGLAADWTAATYELEQATADSNNYTITFNPGTYYFCDVNIPGANNVTFQASASATAANPVIFYVDSPADGGACPTGTGNFTGGKNQLNILGATGVAGSFEIFIYGNPPCTTTCTDILTKNTGTYTDVQIFAPYSTLTANNNVAMTGDFVIGTVNVNINADFVYAGSTSGTGGSGSSLSTYYPSAQQICTTGSTC